jgi:hypothetical protein
LRAGKRHVKSATIGSVIVADKMIESINVYPDSSPAQGSVPKCTGRRGERTSGMTPPQRQARISINVKDVSPDFDRIDRNRGCSVTSG